MKIQNNKVLTLIFSAMAIFSLSGCGSSGVPSDDNLVGADPTTAPKVAPSYPIAAHQGSTVVVHSHVIPPTNGVTHTHQWTQISGPTVTLSTTTAPTTTFTMPTNTTQASVLQHTASNPQTGHTTVTTHTITPIPASTNLDVNVSKLTTITSGNKASLHASASGGDGNYTYTWLQTAGTNVTLDTTHPSTPTFLAPDVNSTETLIFQVTVKDGSGALVSSDELINVVPVVPQTNGPLSLTVNGTTTINAGDPFTLTAIASGGTQPYYYAWNDLGSIGTFNPISRDAHLTQPAGQTSGLPSGTTIHYWIKVSTYHSDGSVDESVEQQIDITIN